MILIYSLAGIAGLILGALFILFINSFVKWGAAHEIEYEQKPKGKVVRLDYYEESLSGDA